MATEIYLGNPPQHVIDWIREHSKPVATPKTKITFTDRSVQEYDWSGEINQQTMVDAGLYDKDNHVWIKEPQIVEIGTKVTSIGSDSFTDISESTFYACTTLTSVMIPDSVTSIGYCAFYICRGLTSVTIGSGVKSIRYGAFGYCEGLMSITIPDSVTSIESDAFEFCIALTSITITANGGDAANVKQMIINSGMPENITWNMPN